MGHKGPRGIKDRLPIFCLLELLEEIKIGISRNALLHWNEIFMNFLNMYTFFRVDQEKVCLCTCKVNASGQEIRKMSDLASLTLIFKQVLSELLNPSFNKSYMKLLSKKQKKLHIFVASFSHKRENRTSGQKRPFRL